MHGIDTLARLHDKSKLTDPDHTQNGHEAGGIIVKT